ncbi:universal stress protein [bacterium SCSIO 12741]|nr:universal stress protein [bacterium SCSIO 12741]
MEKRTVLIATDFSEASRNAIRYGLGLYQGRGYHYILLNTVEPNTASSNAGMIVNVSEIMAKDSLEGLKKEKAWVESLPENEGNTLETVQMFGEFVSCVRQIIKDKNIDMVIIGTTGASGLKEFFVGSNAASVIQEISIPVLTVPFQADFNSIKNILYATDLKKLKNRSILDFLKNLMERRGASMTLLNVVKTQSKVSASDKEEEKQALLDYLGSEVGFETVSNEDTVEGINAYIEERGNVDIIAMVPRKKNFFEKIFSKSIAKKVAYHSRIPMLTLQDG